MKPVGKNDADPQPWRGWINASFDTIKFDLYQDLVAGLDIKLPVKIDFYGYLPPDFYQIDPSVCLSDYVKHIKVSTSLWMKEGGKFPAFEG